MSENNTPEIESIDQFDPDVAPDLSKLPDKDLVVGGTMGNKSFVVEWIARRLQEKLDRKNKD
jgi:hypothetical protein